MAQRELTDRDRAFLELDLAADSGNPVPISPEWDEEHPGLLLSAPDCIPGGGPLPVCGAANFTDSLWRTLPNRLWEQIVVVLTSIDTNQVHAANLADPSPIPGEDLSPPADSNDEDFPVDIDPDAPGGGTSDGEVEELEGGAVLFRNFDVAAVLETTLIPGRYAVFLTYGEYRSNTVELAVVEAVS